MNKFLCALAIVCSFFSLQICGYDNDEFEAFCIVPIANLFHPSVHARFPGATEEEIDHLYEYFPLGTVNNKDCLRIHQLIFHERVSVIAQRGNETCIRIKNAFYHNAPWKGQERTYWTLTRYLLPVSHLNEPKTLPAPLDYQKPESFKQPEHTIFSLTEPFFDAETCQLYSIRTRFIALDQDEISVTVWRYHQKTGQMEPMTIPKEYGVLNESLSLDQTIPAIVQLICQWAQGERTFPSLRGGCSAREYVEPDAYRKSSCELPDGKTIGIYERSDCLVPYAGLDMPGLILSACQIFHAPYCAKNTVTAARYLRSFDPTQDTLEAGDIILTKGYAGIVADRKQNLIIEVRGHQYHKGTVRIVTLSETFQNVRTYDELLELYAHNRPLTLTDSAMKGLLTIPFTILKLKSIFDRGVWNSPKSFLWW